MRLTKKEQSLYVTATTDGEMPCLPHKESAKSNAQIPFCQKGWPAYKWKVFEIVRTQMFEIQLSRYPMPKEVTISVRGDIPQTIKQKLLKNFKAFYSEDSKFKNFTSLID